MMTFLNQTKLFFLAGVFFVQSTAFAHEGHGHLPGSIKTLHGGIAKEGTIFNMEMLNINGKIHLFPLAHEGEKIEFSQVQLTANATPPKGKSFSMKFQIENDAFTAPVDFKGSHRLQLNIKAVYQEKSENFQFIVEK